MKMKKILNLKILNRKIQNYLQRSNIIGFIFCLFSFLFTYYYFELFDKHILTLGLFLFETGLSIVVGSFISAIIIDNEKSN